MSQLTQWWRQRRGSEAKPPESAQKYAPWFEGGEFTTDWVSNRIASWERTFAPPKDTAARILELGSYEGRSATALLTIFPDATITCIDQFADETRERRFDRNMARFGGRTRKIKGLFLQELPKLMAAGETYDLIYLDGGKSRNDVIAHSVLAWPMVRSGGFLLWDDYKYRKHDPPETRPEEAIDWFLATFAKELRPVLHGFQIAVRKM